MTGSGWGRKARWGVTGLCVAVLALVGWFAEPVLGEGGGERVVALLSLLVAVVAAGAPWAWRRGSVDAGPTSAQYEEAALALAGVVRVQWTEEATLRRLFDPEPLPVAWTAAGETSGQADCATTGIGAGSVFTDARELAAVGAAQAGPRLVLVGEPGTGKSTCAVLLTLALLETEPVTRVPVLLTPESFRPEQETPAAWLARRLREDYPLLGDHERFGTDIAEELLARGKVIPVLDGLDELLPARRDAVLRALILAYDPRTPIILTCRSREYAEATERCGALPRAAVLTPSPLRAADSVRALEASDWPGPRRAAWRHIGERLREDPTVPLAQTLRTPLGVNLVRAAYADGTGEPTELLDGRRFPDATVLAGHLLDVLVPSLYARAAAQNPGNRHRDPRRAEHHLRFIARRLERQRTRDLAWWRMADWTGLTRSYVPVSVLAGALAVLPYLVTAVGEARDATSETGDGETWAYLVAARVAAGLSLPFAVLAFAAWLSRRTTMRTWAGGLLPVLLTILGASTLPSVLTLAYATTARNLAWLDYVDAFLRCSAAYWCLLTPVMLLTGLPVRPARPRRGRFSAEHWRRRLKGAGACFLVALAAGALATQVRFSTEQCIVVREGLYYDTGCMVWLVHVALGVGVLIGLIAAAAWWYDNSGRPVESLTPGLSVRQDRRLGLGYALAGSILINLSGAGSVFFPSPRIEAMTTEEAGLALLNDWLSALGPTGAVLALAACCWPYYTLARLRFAVSGHLPWRLQTFLAEAHRLGVLRQVGPVYQFRHALLQERLAERTDAPPALPRPRGAASLNSRT